jgi:hypothetical protein
MPLVLLLLLLLHLFVALAFVCFIIKIRLKEERIELLAPHPCFPLLRSATFPFALLP